MRYQILATLLAPKVVNDMIHHVKRFNVRGQGVLSQARRPLRMDEYHSLISKLHKSGDLTTKYRITALMNFPVPYGRMGR